MSEAGHDSDRLDPLTRLRPDARPAVVLNWLKQGHERFLQGHSLHPHSTRERMQAVIDGQHPLAAVLGCADSRVPVELLQYGDHLSLEDSCRRHTLSAAGNLVHSSVLLTDRLRAGHLSVVAGYYDLHSSRIEWMGDVEPVRYRGAGER